MLFRMLSALPLLALNLFVYFLLSSAQVHGRQSCDQGYNVCSPPGTSAHEDQFIETHLADLYMNLLTTVNPQDGAQPKLFDAAGPRSASGLQLSNLPEAVCCKFITQGCSETGDLTVIGAETTECLLLNTWNVPLCWDRFTTNYYLSDGSYGSITTGIYHCASGGSANLFTGDYNLTNGQSGNLYEQNITEQPNTSTLHLPTPYTSSGIGSAIPATEVGTDASYSTHSPTTIGYGQPQNATNTGTGPITTGGNIPIVTNIVNPSASITPPINNTGTQTGGMCGHKLLLLFAIVVGRAAVQF